MFGIWVFSNLVIRSPVVNQVIVSPGDTTKLLRSKLPPEGTIVSVVVNLNVGRG
jgi:hypothetical protein